MAAPRSRARTGHDRGKLRVGISACLLGEHVRHDGGHKRDAFVVDRLGQFVTWVPVCPEVEIGLGTPREPIEIVLEEHGIRLLGRASRRDLTERMRSYSARRVAELRTAGLCGYILKSRSPSCGLRDVPLHHADGVAGVDRGFFARELTTGLARLPVEDEVRLQDPARRDHFLTRIFAYHRVRSLFEGPWSLEDVERFHAAESFLLLSHDPTRAARLEDLLRRETLSREEFAESYRTLFLATLEPPPAPTQHGEVLRRLVACFEDALPQTETTEIYLLLASFEEETTTRWRVLSWIRSAARRQRLNGLASQTYLEPYPEALTSDLPDYSRGNNAS